MISDFSYAAGENIDIKTKSSRKIEKGIKKLIIIAVVIFTAELIWLFGVTPFVPFSTIEVQSFDGFERSDILLLAGLDENSSFISTNIKEVQKKLESYVLVESAMVIKRFPDKLSIYLNLRQPVAVSLASAGARQMPLYVDKHGVFYKFADAATAETSVCPILSGFENPQLNMRLPAALVPLSENLSKIATSSPELLAAISEIRIERKAFDGYDLVLFPVHSSIKVRLDNNLTEDALRYMLLMLNVFEDASPKPQEIDFRSGMGSYRVKEQSL
jgi:cell division protein FtsQ